MIEVKKVYNGCISLRDYLVKEAIEEKKDIIVKFDKDIMVLSYKDLTQPTSISPNSFKSQYDDTVYYLYDYDWNPEPYTEVDLNRINLLGFEWWKLLKGEFNKDYMKQLSLWLKQQRSKRDVYPDPEEVFKAFKLCQPDEAKVILLGQDPYHTKGVANGLAFASKIPTYCPPSLEIIFNEMEEDIKFGLYLNRDYSLEYLAKQGVFLLNTILTVEKNKPLSHKDIGWEKFTSTSLSLLKAKKVYCLWGAEAKKYETIIKEDNLILKAPHPVAEKYAESKGNRNGIGFKRCKHFSKANEYLENNGIKPITW